MRAGSKSRSKGEMVNRKWKGVIQECERHETDVRSGGGGVSEVKRLLVDCRMGVASNTHVER